MSLLVSHIKSCCGTGKYELTREKLEFSQYMREEGYHIIPIKPEHQLVSLHLGCVHAMLLQ